METVVVTSHPDDEVLWAGGFILRNPCTVICCSVPRHDSIRAWKFFDACESLGAKARLIPATEASPDIPLGHLDILDLSNYDLIVTHNSEGEYGHLHHRSVHEHIVNHWGHKEILTFGYRKGSIGEIRLDLSKEEYERKLTALRKYDHLWPYRGTSIPKWEALLHRYGEIEGIDFSVETFDRYKK